MALKRFVIDGFGQLELNQVAFPRDGRIEAQCALGDDFAEVPAENGMLLAVVKKAEHKITFADASAENQLYALNYTTEHMYDERHNALKDFSIKRDKKFGYFYPRMGYLSVQDKFTTNCLCFDTDEFADEQETVAPAEAESDAQ